jgi:PAS domain S-box-containing protein
MDRLPGHDVTPLAPPPDWNEKESHAHTVQFYGSDTSLLDGLGRFIGSALGAGDAGVVIATKAHLRGLEERLKARGFDVALARRQGRYVRLDPAETLSRFMVNGWPDATRFLEVMGRVIAEAQASIQNENPRVVAFGEMVALLWADGKPEAALRLEQLWNDLARTRAFHLRCAYPMGDFHQEGHGDPFLKICAEHSRVFPDETYTSLMSEEERLRSISILQQKAQALNTEVVERKKAERSLRNREAELADFLENAVEGVQQVGPDQTILWANKAFLNLLGYSAEEYVGHSLAEFHVDREVFEDFWRKLMAGEDIYDFPTELRCKDGLIKHVLIHSNGLWENGRFIRTRCFVRDVTEHKRMEEALRRSEKLAATGRLAASIAHEINNPLEAVTNLIYIAESTCRQDSVRRHLQMADQELRRVANITRQTLGFYRDNSAPTTFKVAGVIDDALMSHSRKLANRKIHIEREYRWDGEMTGLRGEIRQVLANLITNAIDASHPGDGLRVRLELGRDWSSKRTGARITVADHGTGISPTHISRLFEPFFTTKKDVGTGLGLWVTKEIVEKHHGSLRVRSSIHLRRHGTVFSLFLPLTANVAAFTPAAAA